MLRTRLFALITGVILGLTGLAPHLHAEGVRSIFSWNYRTKNVDIRTSDDLLLKARLYFPTGDAPGKVHPVVIFGNSWIVTQWEYEIPARILASKGYIVLSYQTRGFFLSQGNIGIGGPNEIGDIKILIDWVQSNTPADMQNIALAGISYGGGISLLAAAQDPRVKTAVAMNCWGDVMKSLYSEETLHNAWLKVLVKSGEITGRLDPELYQITNDLRTNTNMDSMKEWAYVRSPVNYTDQLNARQVPIFVANSHQDELFPPLQMEEFYTKLTGPKYFYIDDGVHAGSAIPGLFGRKAEVWTKVYAWLDHYLVDSNSPVPYGVNYHTRTRDVRFSEFADVKRQDLTFKPLNTTLNKDVGGYLAPVISLAGNVDSNATTGKILLNDLTTVYGEAPPRVYVPALNKMVAAVFQTDVLTHKISIIGAPRLTIALPGHETPVQIVAYLYDVDSSQFASLMTYGAITVHEAKTSMQSYTFELGTNGYQVPAGHKMMLVLDTKDPLYLAPLIKPYEVDILAEASGLTMEFPYAED
ncbi:MAG: alpha/beta hydrolase [Chitinophagaceae bacterium]|nr:alpha/beta hydrolase [Oligoflexus sp.]